MDVEELLLFYTNGGRRNAYYIHLLPLACTSVALISKSEGSVYVQCVCAYFRHSSYNDAQVEEVYIGFFGLLAESVL